MLFWHTPTSRGKANATSNSMRLHLASHPAVERFEPVLLLFAAILLVSSIKLLV